MKYTVSIFTENKPGVLYRIANLFLRRKINIESLTVSEIPGKGYARFTIILAVDKLLMQKLVKQIERIIEVVSVYAGEDTDFVFKEVALVKVAMRDKNEKKAIEQVVKKVGAHIVYVNHKYLVIEEAGSEEEVSGLLKSLANFKISDIAVSGRTAVLKTSKQGGEK